MATLPGASSDIDLKGQERSYPTETFLVDKSNGSIRKKGGGLPAMEQAVEIILNTERYRNQIYTANFGREFNKLIGKPPEYVTSMLKRRIREAFSMDSRIIAVENFIFDTTDSGTVKCTFDVNTVFGIISKEVEV